MGSVLQVGSGTTTATPHQISTHYHHTSLDPHAMGIEDAPLADMLTPREAPPAWVAHRIGELLGSAPQLVGLSVPTRH